MRRTIVAAYAALFMSGCAAIATANLPHDPVGMTGGHETDTRAADPVLADQIRRADSVVAEFRRDMPGAAFLVARNGRVIYERYLGAADLEHDRPVTAETPFQVGSVSKQFTALAVALLAQDGKVKLDADIRTYLPEMPDYGEPIRVSDLIHHTSGLRDELSVAFAAGWHPQDLVDQKTMLSIVRSQTGLNFKPGSDRAYSNAGYLLLAELVERVSGKSLRTFAAERIFAPLGMRHTFVADKAGEIVPDRVMSYGLGPTGIPLQDKHTHAYYGAAGVWTTARDLELWSRELLHPKVFDARLVASLKQSGWFRDGTAHGYAFGMYARPRAGHAAIGHAGSINGYRADIMSLEAEDASIIVMTSRPANAQDISDRLADVFLNDGAGTHPAGAQPTERELSRIEGTWTADWSPMMEFHNDNGRLVRRQAGTPPVEQEAVFLPDAGFHFDDPLTIYRLSNDGVAILQENIASNVNPPIRWRRGEKTAPMTSEIQKLEGCYRSADIDTTWKLSVKDGTLYREGVRLDRMPLTPGIRDVFELPALAGVVKIARDGAGKPEALLVSFAFGRVRNLPFTRVPC